jgi:hypothetical protein
MPYRFDFEYTHQVLCCTFKGRVTEEDLRQFHRDALRVVERTNPRAAIINFRHVREFHVTGGAMRAMARCDPLMPDMTQPRFIVAPADLVFGMSRIYQLTGEPTRPKFRVVRTKQAALSAIGVKDPNFMKIPEEFSGVPEP